MPAATAERMPPPCCGRSCRVAQPPGPAFIILCAARRCPRLCAFCMRGFLGGLCFLCGSAARRPVRLGGFLFLFLFLFLGGSAARWLGGSAARRLGGLAACAACGLCGLCGSASSPSSSSSAASAALLPLRLCFLCFLCGSAACGSAAYVRRRDRGTRRLGIAAPGGGLAA